MVHTLPVVALAHLLSDQPRHHALHPLLPDYRILCGLERLVVVVVYAIEGGRNGGFGGFERLGLWGWHVCWWPGAAVKSQWYSNMESAVTVGIVSGSKTSSMAVVCGSGEVKCSSPGWSQSALPLTHPLFIDPRRLVTFPTLPLAMFRPSPTEPLRALPPLLLLLLLRLVLALLRLLAPIILAAAAGQAVAHLPLPLVESHHVALVDLSQKSLASLVARGA